MQKTERRQNNRTNTNITSVIKKQKIQICGQYSAYDQKQVILAENNSQEGKVIILQRYSKKFLVSLPKADNKINLTA